MKRLSLAVALLFSLMMSVFPVAFANADGMVAAYISVPDDWENPCLWAWDDAGNNAFSAWPGGEAEADPNNPGWYYCYLPNWAANVIVNANGGTIQTDALAIGGGSFWVTVTSPEDAEITYDALTAGDAPEYVEKITIYAKVPASWGTPGIWAWLDPEGKSAFDAWPGPEMQGSSGEWYSAKAPSWVNCVIINGSGGSVQTTDLKDIGKENETWIVVADDNSAEVYFENPDLMVANITVRAKVPADWSEPHLWAWLHPDGTNVFAAWPGEALTLNGDWYELAIPGWANSFIINAGAGSVQTGDMKELEAGRDIWIVVTDASTYIYDYAEIDTSGMEQPPAPAPATPEPTPPAEITPPPAAAEEETGTSALWIALSIAGVAVIAVIITVLVKRKK